MYSLIGAFDDKMTQNKGVLSKDQITYTQRSGADGGGRGGPGGPDSPPPPPPPPLFDQTFLCKFLVLYVFEWIPFILQNVDSGPPLKNFSRSAPEDQVLACCSKLFQIRKGSSQPNIGCL